METSPDITIEKQLFGLRQIRDLITNPNLKYIVLISYYKKHLLNSSK
jgi:hypothetical protein